MGFQPNEGAEPVAGYVLVRPLGRGGFGEVWEARAPGGVRVALKFVRLGGREAGAEERALEVIRDIRHPHLLDVQFAVRIDDCLVIAMPLCDRSAMDRLEACREGGLPGIPHPELAGYMDELAGAIDFLNGARHRGGDGRVGGVQHRDIKPHNIFLVGGPARLADFGLAKLVEASLVSHTGSMSPHYAAPEAFEGEVSRWSDQYSLAVTYAHLRTGCLPFKGSASQLLFAHLHAEPNLDGLEGPEREAVVRALAKKPGERWPNCRDFAAALREATPGRARPEGQDGGGAARIATTVFDRPRTTEWTGDPEPAEVGTGKAAATRVVRRGRLAGPAIALAAIAVLAISILLVRPGAARTGAGPGVARSGDEPARAAASGPSGDPELAARAYAVLNTYCYDCHGGANDVGEDLNVLDRQSLVRRPDSGSKSAYVEPGEPARSLLWEYSGIASGDGKYRMPKKGAPQPSPEERQLLERWIASGAEFPRAVTRAPVDAKSTLAAIRGHLDGLAPADRPYRRFLTLGHLNNDPTVGDDAIRTQRAAASKLLNSLSWRPEIAVPEAIDAPAATILAFDLRGLGWDAEDWKLVAQAYAYGVTHPDDATLNDLEREIARLSGTRLPALRADWFVATVSRPPLYDRLLKLPASLRELEARLDVHLERNFDRDVLRRGGLVTSGVSRHNRLVERHPTPFGAYWRSYDFGSSAGTGNLLLFPLGPKFPGNRYGDQAFEQAGGEVIFHLPNGLQGYMLADAKDRRLDAPAPITIVRDRDETAGTPEVVNGLSCLACHKNGMKGFVDEVRGHPAVFGEAREKLDRLYAPASEMDGLLARDEKRFLDALDRAIGPFLKVGADAGKSARDLIEPIGEVARLYNKDLSAEAIAAELEMPDIKAVRDAVGADKFRELGLGPLLDAKAVKRELWEGRGFSLFHRVSNELGRARSEIK